MKFRTLLLGLAALFIASSAAFFSVTGLSKLFAGASTAVILMASSLEFGKLIAASFLHSYWGKISGLLKTYLTIGVVVLIFITSAGIYGFLTSAYQTTADQLGIIDKQVQVVELKKQRFQEQLDGYTTEKNQLAESINELSKGLSNNVIQYKDSETGEIITTTSSATRRALENQLNNAREQRDVVSQRIEALTDSITTLDLRVLDIQQSSEVAAEVGPLKYMAEVTGKPMSTIVNWFALLIVFVFDPMAVSLVIAFNAAMKIDKGEKDKKKVVEKRELYGEEPDDEESDLWDNTLNDGLEDEEWDEDHALDEALNDMVSDEDMEELNEDLFGEEDEIEDSEEWEDEYEPNEALKEAAERYKESNVSYEDNQLETDNLNTNDELPDLEDVELSVSEPIEEVDEELAVLKRDTRRMGVDIDGDGTIDGYDNTGNGLIDEPVPSSSKRAQYVINTAPFYARPDFNWGDKKKWINNQNAVNYWLTHVKNQKDTTYPEDFDSKTY